MRNVIFLILTFLIWSAVSVNAQVRIGGDADPNESAVLDLNATNAANNSKLGLALPRVTLTSTASFAPLKAHVAGMMVYNTGTVGDVTPGTYYNDGSKWIRVGSGALTVETDGGLTIISPMAGNESYTFGISTGGVTSTKIANSAVTLAKIAANSVDSTKIVDKSIGSADIANNAVITTNIRDANVTTAKIAANAIDSTKIKDGAIGVSDLATNSVSSIKIQDGTIVAADLASNAVTTSKITNASVTLAKMAANSVDSAKIVDKSIGSADIADNAVITTNIRDANVTTAKIADAAITSAKIADATIAAGDLANGAVTLAKMAANSVDSTKIVDKSIGSADIANNAVITANIRDANVTAAKIADSAITTAKIAADAIDSTKIKDGAIGVSDLATNSVSSIKIQDGTIVAADLASNAVTTSKITNASVTLAKMAANSVDSTKIVDKSIGSADIANNAVITANIRDANVTAAKIADSAITTAKIAANAIDSTKIKDGAIGVSDLATNSVSSVKIQDGTIVAADLASNAVSTVKIADKAVTAAKLADGVLTSTAAPIITAQPKSFSWSRMKDSNGDPNSTVTSFSPTLTITASGSGLSYKWYKKAVNRNAADTQIETATTNSYAPTLTAWGMDSYYCVISNAYGSVTSNMADVAAGCGAKTADGGWLKFMCHNLGALSLTATQSLDAITFGSGTTATDSTSSDAKGWLYQWGRATDGHQWRKSDAAAGPVSVSGAAQTPSGANAVKFITNSTSPYDWRTPQYDYLWRNWPDGRFPCPSGWKVPSSSDWGALYHSGATYGAPAQATANTWVWVNKGYAIRPDGVTTTLFLPAAGCRYDSSATLSYVGSSGDYWSSATAFIGASHLAFDSSRVSPETSNYRANGFSVRCVAE